jgi:hypothetical protein
VLTDTNAVFCCECNDDETGCGAVRWRRDMRCDASFLRGDSCKENKIKIGMTKRKDTKKKIGFKKGGKEQK